MNEQQRLQRQQERAAQVEREAAFGKGGLPMNCAPDFWRIYNMRPGMARRRALAALFKRYPLSKLPVNNRSQANTIDPDLRYFLKRGVLVRQRDGGSRRHALNRSSGQRQTYLVPVMTD